MKTGKMKKGTMRLQSQDAYKEGRQFNSTTAGKKAIPMDRKEIEKALRKVLDPHTGIDVVEMGLIREIDLKRDGSAKILFVPTTPFCPMTQYLMDNIKKAAESAGAKKVKVEMGR